MSKEFELLVDIFCDLPDSYLKEQKLTPMYCSYSVDGTDYLTEENPEDLSPKEFYSKMREGADTKTVAIDPLRIKNEMLRFVEQGKDVLYIAFSSALSGTYNNGRIAAEELSEEYPDADIRVVDSLSASLGLGLLVNYAVTLKSEGKTLAETTEILERDKRKFCHYFTVDDLNFLHRGGRVSKATAIVGSLLGIKPVLHVDDEGRLISIGKVRGRKQSLDELVNKMAQKMGDNENKVVYVSHGDCEKDAKYVADQVKKRFGVKSFLINYVGLAIGSHSGPGTVALFFVGDSRAE